MRDTRRTRLILALLLLTAFTFITLDVRGSGSSPLDSLRSAGQTVFGPVERAAAAVVRPISRFLDGLGSLGSSQERIDALEQENQRLLLQLRTSEVDRNRAGELDRLLNIAGIGRLRILPAEVIAVSSGRGFARTITIDAGRRDGLAIDLTVISGDGLVGRVVEVGPTTATVLLITDQEFTVGARLAGSMEIGAVTGQGADPMLLELLDPQAALRVGDQLVTLGSREGRPFVAGIPIGEVVRVVPTPGALTRSADVLPFVDPTRLSLVGVVVQPPRTNPRDSLLPPEPTTSPVPLQPQPPGQAP